MSLLDEIRQRHKTGYAAPLDGLSHEDAEIVCAILDELTKDRAELLSEIDRLTAELNKPSLSDRLKALGFTEKSPEQQAISMRQISPSFVWPLEGDDDPTPYCHGCGSMTKAGCDCGPIAENE